MAKKVIVIGGGIIGLSSAFYLQQEGFDVTVIDKTDMLDGCSYGNAGYVCPSHFVPMATPGIVKKGLKWMWNAKSPFYIQPRLNMQLMDWGLKFMKSATREHVQRSAIPLRDIAVLSKQLYEEWTRLTEFDFAYERTGLLELFQSEENMHHAEEMAAASAALGLEAKVLDKAGVQAMIPGVELKALGGLYFGCDAQLYPNKLMRNLLAYLPQKGVQLLTHREVTGFVKDGQKITGVKTAQAIVATDHVVVAAGVWSNDLARQLELKLPMVGGRGYSITYENAPYKIPLPVILTEARVAVSPMDGNKIRFGGTMEITGVHTPPRMNRVEGILESVNRYFPEYNIPLPSPKEVWYGYRPCSADGLPYIGPAKRFNNVTIATGHSMLGLSLGAGTGKLVSELVSGKATSIDVAPFNADRFA